MQLWGGGRAGVLPVTLAGAAPGATHGAPWPPLAYGVGRARDGTRWPLRSVAVCQVRAPRRASCRGRRASRGARSLGGRRLRQGGPSWGGERPRHGTAPRLPWPEGTPCWPGQGADGVGPLRTTLGRGAYRAARRAICRAERLGRVGGVRPGVGHGAEGPRAVRVAVGAGGSPCRLAHAAGGLPSMAGVQAVCRGKPTRSSRALGWSPRGGLRRCQGACWSCWARLGAGGSPRRGGVRVSQGGRRWGEARGWTRPGGLDGRRVGPEPEGRTRPAPNKRLQPTPDSVRCAPALGRG